MVCDLGAEARMKPELAAGVAGQPPGRQVGGCQSPGHHPTLIQDPLSYLRGGGGYLHLILDHDRAHYLQY